MTDIKTELTDRLREAEARYESARLEYEAATEYVKLIDALVKEFERLTKDNTRAFRAVPDESGPIQNAPKRPAEVFPPAAVITCEHCGAVLVQHGSRWVDSDGYDMCGGERGTVRHHAVSSNGGRVDQQPTSVRLPAEMVPPRPGPTTSDPGGVHPAADISATRPDEPQGGAQ